MQRSLNVLNMFTKCFSFAPGTGRDLLFYRPEEKRFYFFILFSKLLLRSMFVLDYLGPELRLGSGLLFCGVQD